jgi:hypothetical protein
MGPKNPTKLTALRKWCKNREGICDLVDGVPCHRGMGHLQDCDGKIMTVPANMLTTNRRWSPGWGLSTGLSHSEENMPLERPRGRRIILNCKVGKKVKFVHVLNYLSTTP